jgi:hypothetical protein
MQVHELKNLARLRLLDQLHEEPDNRHIAEGEDQRPNIGDAEQVHDGVRKP